LEATNDPGEDVANLWAKQYHDANDNNGHQYEYERILNQTLAFLMGQL
jgi:hypothetical protein